MDKKANLFAMRSLFLVFIFFALAGSDLYATHLRAGEITLQRTSCTDLTFRITITVYTDTGSPIKFGDGTLDFGDGSTPVTTPTIDNITRPELGLDVGYVTFTTTHTFGGPGRYTISYLEPNRNAGILNMTNSVDTRFYLETQITIDPFLGCSNTPLLLVPPIDKGCTGAAFFHNPGAYDPDGDSVSYELAIPKREKGVFVNGYIDPNAGTFYERIGLNYGQANETGDGPPTFSINPTTGTLIWNAPGAPGEYNVAFIVKEWRKINGIWIQIGYVVRDMQIIIEDCLNQRPELEVPADICVEAGTIITEDIFGIDPDFDSLKIEAFSQVFALNPSPATYAPNPAVFQHTALGKKAKLSFTWATDCTHIKEQPYQIVFKVSDKSSNGPTLVQFKTWNIRVVGPAPEWKPPVVNLSARSVNLSWENYECKIKAESMEVWRRVDEFAFTPPECVTGMPDNLGYTKIADVSINTTSFNDTNNGEGLNVGAQYCYRLVAVFPLPGGGKSYVSQEICIPPIEADAPVITNVTIDVTSTSAGEVTVRWTPPFDADPLQFPPPYTYEVMRAEGFTGDFRILMPHTGKLSDTFFVDTGLNTKETVYNYRIVAYASNGTKVDTSPTASTVRLEASPQFLQISLTWNAEVPWSNKTQDYPMHLIYRGSATATDATVVLIDSVDVNANGMTYIDDGSFNGQPLKETDTYCYKIMTRGAYGNPAIAEPLKNFSQLMCARPNDNLPPCTPELAIKAQSCEEYFQNFSCSSNLFSNTLTWKKPPSQTCREDIQGYKIYRASTTTGEYELLDIPLVRDTFYIHSNLPSFAGCYKISAVDRANNESELSEPFCFDNCPYYELPNVFTPDGDDCNELFSAFSDRIVVDENGIGPCGGLVDFENLKRRCARFVQKVDITIYNRWGKEVFSYQSGGERSIYIDWDGRDNSGKELSAGIYYYSAEVTFDVVDTRNQKQIIKGWVQIVR